MPADDVATRRTNRRDTLKFGAAASLGLAAGSTLRNAAAQEATPATSDLSMAKPTVTLDTATTLIEAAHQHAVGLGAAMNIAVVDESGMLKAFHRMDGNNSAASVEISQRKAFSAAAFRTPTHQVAEAAAENPQRIASLTTLPGFTLLLGGYPIMDGDAVIGGIGVSGGSPEQDMEVAEAALAALAQ